MNLEISYAEMSFLRDLVREKQYQIWKEKFASRLPKNVDADEAYHKFWDQDIIAPCCDVHCVIVLLKKFQKFEEEIQQILKVDMKKVKAKKGKKYWGES